MDALVQLGLLVVLAFFAVVALGSIVVGAVGEPRDEDLVTRTAREAEARRKKLTGR